MLLEKKRKNNLVNIYFLVSAKLIKARYRLANQIKQPFKRNVKCKVDVTCNDNDKRRCTYGSQVTLPLEIDEVVLKPVLKRHSVYDDKNNNSNLNNDDNPENDDEADFIEVDFSDSDFEDNTDMDGNPIEAAGEILDTF